MGPGDTSSNRGLGSPVAIVDYPASLPNVLYRLVTGRVLETEDPYEVAGVFRDTVKFLMTMMINNDSVGAAARAANKNIVKKKAMTHFVSKNYIPSCTHRIINDITP